MALYDENIIEDQFQAWIHGAVQPSLYEKYKDYGFDKIPQIEISDAIPEEFISFANDVYEAYGHLTGNELEALNHEEDPWVKARGNCKPWERCTTEISEDDMKSFYRKLKEADEKDTES